jgi:hypothetical protein
METFLKLTTIVVKIIGKSTPIPSQITLHCLPAQVSDLFCMKMWISWPQTCENY